MSVFESGYKDGLTKEEGVELVTRAIRAGVYNDLGSGSNIDVCVITKDGVEMMRNHEYLQDKTYARQFPKKIPVGTSKVLRERIITRDLVEVSAGGGGAETMMVD